MKIRTALDLSHDRLLSLLDYDPATGVFRWKRRKQQEAGHIEVFGYRSIGIARARYMAHRLAWFYRHGVWPGGEIDHINGDRADNRMANLREATRSQQVMNSKGRAGRASRFRNVQVRKDGYVAHTHIDGKRVYLGFFKSEDEAGEVATRAIAENYGAYARD